MKSMLTVEGAIFANLQTAGSAPFVLVGGVVSSLSLGALQLDDLSGHLDSPASNRQNNDDYFGDLNAVFLS
jgi:hypothetical protein